ncbi:hypothetical protein KP509_08G063100 [Ceratopteris richardii]|uniref:Uncharacterized protein n=2 Tax=Ceratopteris richardii TaxID=49495 RepID=A0A8T2U682_CERRI|nr:hypothetical protein KP509_08G063100 [Ceratopteris richardii]
MSVVTLSPLTSSISVQFRWLLIAISLLFSLPLWLPLIIFLSVLALTLLLPVVCALVGFLSWHQLRRLGAAPLPTPSMGNGRQDKAIPFNHDVSEVERSNDWRYEDLKHLMCRRKNALTKVYNLSPIHKPSSVAVHNPEPIEGLSVDNPGLKDINADAHYKFDSEGTIFPEFGMDAEGQCGNFSDSVTLDSSTTLSLRSPRASFNTGVQLKDKKSGSVYSMLTCIGLIDSDGNSFDCSSQCSLDMDFNVDLDDHVSEEVPCIASYPEIGHDNRYKSVTPDSSNLSSTSSLSTSTSPTSSTSSTILSESSEFSSSVWSEDQFFKIKSEQENGSRDTSRQWIMEAGTSRAIMDIGMNKKKSQKDSNPFFNCMASKVGEGDAFSGWKSVKQFERAAETVSMNAGATECLGIKLNSRCTCGQRSCQRSDGDSSGLQTQELKDIQREDVQMIAIGDGKKDRRVKAADVSCHIAPVASDLRHWSHGETRLSLGTPKTEAAAKSAINDRVGVTVITCSQGHGKRLSKECQGNAGTDGIHDPVNNYKACSVHTSSCRPTVDVWNHPIHTSAEFGRMHAAANNVKPNSVQTSPGLISNSSVQDGATVSSGSKLGCPEFYELLEFWRNIEHAFLPLQPSTDQLPSPSWSTHHPK